MRLFVEMLNPPCIVAVPQTHHQPRLILKLSAQPNKGTPIFNRTTDREIPPESMHFGRAFPCILQAIWEAYLAEGPFQISKLDVTDAYHRGTLQPYQVGFFAYVVSLAP